jgi:ArsR family transcriptional regulator
MQMRTSTLDASSELMRVVADPMRMQILELLADEELCVCHLTEELGAAQNLVSHHLRVLRDAGLVETERHRYWTYYRLRPEMLRPLADRIATLSRKRSARRRRPCG